MLQFCCRWHTIRLVKPVQTKMKRNMKALPTDHWGWHSHASILLGSGSVLLPRRLLLPLLAGFRHCVFPQPRLSQGLAARRLLHSRRLLSLLPAGQARYRHDRPTGSGSPALHVRRSDSYAVTASCDARRQLQELLQTVQTDYPPSSTVPVRQCHRPILLSSWRAHRPLRGGASFCFLLCCGRPATLAPQATGPCFV